MRSIRGDDVVVSVSTTVTSLATQPHCRNMLLRYHDNYQIPPVSFSVDDSIS